MTQISLATSLHLHHGETRPDPSSSRLAMMDFVPVGLLCLKAYADQANIGAEVRVTELNGLINAEFIPNDAEFYEHVVDAILRPGDDLVGLMTDADSLHHTMVIADLIKRRQPRTAVCLGGPAASPLSARIMSAFACVDYVVRGEGEETFVDLIKCLRGQIAPHAIQGLTWRDGARVVENGPRHMEKELDRLPMPAFDAYDMATGAPLYLDVGRGCPFSCSFCATAPFWRRQYRMKSIERICDELVLIRDRYARRRVNFSHDIFTCDRAWTLQFCDRLIANPVGVSWTCSTRTDIIDAEVLGRMAAAGCEEIYYGIETGSQQLQKRIDKHLDLERAHEIIRATAAAGIRPVTGFIVGYPFETYETLADTLQRFFQYLETGGYRAHIFVLSPFADAPMYRDYGGRLDRPAPYYDLNLDPGLINLGRQLTHARPDIFASAYRYPTPDLPTRLVDAAEELSPPLSMLRALWPHVLPRYESTLGFYLRWTEWIAADNSLRRPGYPYPYQAGAAELLRFVQEEMGRLNVPPDEPLHELVRYEQMKLDASVLEVTPGLASADRPPSVDGATIVHGHQSYLLSEFKCDIESLLRKALPAEADTARRRWVAVIKVAPNLLNTINLDGRAVELLASARQPVSAGELIGSVSGDEMIRDLRAIDGLVKVGLLTVAAQDSAVAPMSIGGM